MKKLNILFLSICILAVNACAGFLDVKPSNQADSSTCITSAKDAQVMMNGLMSKLTSSSYYGRDFVLYGDTKSGDITIYTGGYDDGMYYFSHKVESGAYNGFWSQGYNCLLQANNIITNLQKMKDAKTTEDIDGLLGQALTARALIHFDLVRLYGQPYNMNKGAYGVPIVIAQVDAAEQRQRNTVEEVYTQVVKDLNDAAPLLSKTVSNGYINYYANQAILAKVYMYMDNWSAALAAAKNVIGGPYTLYTPDQWVASWSKAYGSESIFELAMVPQEGDLGTSSLGVRYSRKGDGTSNAYGYFMASKYWKEIMGDDDVRWGIMTYDHMHGDASSDPEGRSDWKDCCYKYNGSVSRSGDGKATYTAVNIKVIRLSEVYLMAAESALKSNDKQAAADYLNAISIRNPKAAKWTSATVTEDEIYKELRRETLTEGKVFFEAMRLNKTLQYEDDAWGFGTTSQYREQSLTRDFFRCILPISKAELNANPKIQQNPGY